MNALLKQIQLPFKKASSKPFWLLEVGNPILKGMFCSREASGVRIHRVVFEPVAGPVREGFKNALATLFTGTEASAPVHALFSRNVASLRQLELPSKEDKELSSMVDLQVTSQSPYSRDEVTTDWHKLSSPRAGFSRVLVAMATHPLVKDYFDAFQELGLSVEKAGLISSGLPRFVLSGLDGDVLLIELNQFYTEFQLISKKEKETELLYSRAVTAGEQPASEEEGLERLLTESRRTLEALKNEGLLTDKPSRLVVMGASRHLEPFREKLALALGVPCEAIPLPSEGFSFAEGALENLKNFSLDNSFFGMLGSLQIPESQHFRLMSQDLGVRRGLEEQTQEIVHLGVLLSLFAVLLTGFFGGRIYKVNRALDQVNQMHQKNLKETEETEKIRDILKEVQTYRGPERSAQEFLKVLHEKTSEGIYYKSILYEQGKAVSLKGYAKEMSFVFEFVNGLNGLGWFKGVETKYAARKKVQKEDLIEFEIVGNFVG